MRGRPFQLFMLVWALAALLLAQRLFPTRGELAPVVRRYYERRVVTRRLPQSRPHALAYAQ